MLTSQLEAPAVLLKTRGAVGASFLLFIRELRFSDELPHTFIVFHPRTHANRH